MHNNLKLFRSCTVRLIGGVLTAVVVCALFGGRTAAQSQGTKVVSRVDCFCSAGQSIGVEVFAPDAAGKYPCIMLLHAIDGLDTGFGDHYRCLASGFARNGYVVHLVHYFDATGTRSQDVQETKERFLNLVDQKADVRQKKIARQTFDVWVNAVSDAVTFAREQDNVDGERVGVVGISLGAFVGLAVASQEKLKIKAVVDLFGGLPGEMAPGMKELPPTLVIHGDKDATIPVEKAYALYGWMLSQKLRAEIVVYKNTDHVFMNEKGFDRWAAFCARVKAEQFLDKHLKTELSKK